MEWIDLVVGLVRFCGYIVGFLCLLSGDELGRGVCVLGKFIMRAIFRHGCAV